MKNEAKTEVEMRDAKVPWPSTIEELTEYIQSLVEREHDYGTTVYAMSMAAVAAYNYVAHKKGTSGFQASCADIDIIRRNRGWKGSLMLINGENMLYPQYNIHEKVNDALDKWADWAAGEAAERLAKCPDTCKEVKDHWEKLVADKKLRDAKASNEATSDGCEGQS
jgi:hypothetical protein